MHVKWWGEGSETIMGATHISFYVRGWDSPFHLVTDG